MSSLLSEFIGSPFVGCSPPGTNEPDDILSFVIYPVSVPDDHHASLKGHPDCSKPFFTLRVMRVRIGSRQFVTEDGPGLVEGDAVPLEI